MIRLRLAWLAGAGSLLLAGCPGSLQNPERFGAGECNAEMVLAQTCGSNAICHDADTPQGGLDLASPGVRSRVIDVMPSLCVMSGAYVDSANPSASLILDKINPSPSCGTQMPPPPERPLNSAQIECITSWVMEITGGGSGDASAGDASGGDAATDAAAGDASGDGAMP